MISTVSGRTRKARIVVADGLPYAELPRSTVDTTYSLPGGTQVTATDSSDFTTKLAASASTDNAVIILNAGTTYTGTFTLPARTGAGWCYIISSALASLPASGKRIGTGDTANMPTIQATTGNVAFQTASQAAKYRLVGLRCLAPSTLLQNAVIRIGNSESSEANLPADIIVDRCIVKGDTTNGVRRGIELNGKRCAAVDSYIYDVKEDGADTQAVWLHNTPGPVKIDNNYLEAAGENVMTGGADPAISGLVPSDITITKNCFYKPLAWIAMAWDVKNLLEFKNAQRVLVEGNILKNNWANAQSGMAFLITPRNQNNTAPWSVTKDITFRSNKILNTAQGINIGGSDDNYPSQDTIRIHIVNNLVEVANVNGEATRRLHQMVGGPDDVRFANNTFVFKSGDSSLVSLGFMENNPDALRTVWINNVLQSGDGGNYGIIGTATGEGNATFSAYFTDPSGSYNMVIAPASSSNYSTWSNCVFPSNVTAAKFVDYAGANYALASDSPGHNAGSDGADMGANFTTLNAATLHSEDGQW